jgi:hypothetical protein
MSRAAAEVVASSYAAAFQLRASCTRLALSAARDVACANLMCARAGGGCACRLAAVLDGLPGARLGALELARNALPLLPAAVWRRAGLARLDASDNALEALGLEEDAVAAGAGGTGGASGAGGAGGAGGCESLAPPTMPELEEVDLRGNLLRAAALAPLLRDARRFPRLRRVLVARNPAAEELAVFIQKGKLAPREIAMLDVLA